MKEALQVRALTKSEKRKTVAVEVFKKTELAYTQHHRQLGR